MPVRGGPGPDLSARCYTVGTSLAPQLSPPFAGSPRMKRDRINARFSVPTLSNQQINNEVNIHKIIKRNCILPTQPTTCKINAVAREGYTTCVFVWGAGGRKGYSHPVKEKSVVVCLLSRRAMKRKTTVFCITEWPVQRKRHIFCTQSSGN